MSYKTNCKMYAEEYIGNPGKVPVCEWTGKIEPDCDNCSGPKQTNAYRIRQMSVEELARHYAKRIVRCYGCEAVAEDNCFECQLDWLKSPVEVDNG